MTLAWRQTHRSVAAAALVLVAVLAIAASAGAADRPLSATLRKADARIDWTNVRPDERLRVLRRWAHAPRPFDVLVAGVADRLAIRRGSVTELAQGNHTDLQIGGAGATWEINLSTDVLRNATKLDAHITLHELGHVIDGALIDDATMAAIFADFARSPAWQPCWPMPRGSSSRCVRAPEIFADQFAFWATGRREVRSSYNVPPLLHRAAFGRLMQGVATDHLGSA